MPAVTAILLALLTSVFLSLCCLCWPDVKRQRLMFPAVSHTRSSAWAEQQLDVYLPHTNWDEPSAHSDMFKGGSPLSILAKLWWWWWSWWWPALVVSSLCACCCSGSGWISTRPSSVGGELWKIVRMPSPLCSWSVARPERPLSDTTRDTLQLDSLQMEGQDDCTCATEQDGGDVSGSYKGKRCEKKSNAITEKIHWDKVLIVICICKQSTKDFSISQ